ncbi:MAG: M42 family metallopeptidase [Candidatus Methanofastidiosia archaeon]
MRKLLKKLTRACGISGFEKYISEIVIKEVKDFADDISMDSMGNVIAMKKGMRSGPKMMVSAHMDEVGGMVRHIDKNGFIYFDLVGSQNPIHLLGTRITVGQKTTGIINSKGKKEKKLNPEDLYIDIGAKNKKDVEKRGVLPGTPISRKTSFEKLLGKRYVSKAFDNRAGLCVMIETFKRVKNFSGCLFAVASCQEEVGMRGAKVASYSIKPDIAIALDVTFAYDTPQKKNTHYTNTFLGRGPALTLKDDGFLLSPKMRKYIEKIAKKRRIPLQYDVSKGSTDASPIQLNRGGVHTAAILIPLRYMHTAQEIIDIGDLNHAVDLLTGIIEESDQYEI